MSCKPETAGWTYKTSRILGLNALAIFLQLPTCDEQDQLYFTALGSGIPNPRIARFRRNQKVRLVNRQ
jgi:hypothetical protein